MQRLISGLVGCVILSGLVAVAEAQDCDVSTAHSHLSRAALQLATAYRADASQAEKNRALGAAHSLLLTAAAEIPDDPATWYYFGQYYAARVDAEGADSSFRKVEEVKPECIDEIREYRAYAAHELATAGVAHIEAGRLDSADARLRSALLILPEDPNVAFNLATVHAQRQDWDDARRFFQRAAEGLSPDDSLQVETYKTAVINVARIYSFGEEHDSAAVWYELYRSHDPADLEAAVGLARAYEAIGRTDRARGLFDSVTVRIRELGDIELFMLGISFFDSQAYARSAEAFEILVERNPFYRDALLNLASAHFSVALDRDPSLSGARHGQARDAAARRLLEVARRLNEVDPLGEQSGRLLLAGYSLNDMEDSTFALMDRLEARAYHVRLDAFSAQRDEHTIQGAVINTGDRQTAVPAIVFEFLNADGGVVATRRVSGESLPPNTERPFELRARGSAIVAWRYRPDR